MTKASMVEFQKNRPSFPIEELEKYDDQWVAFSMDAKKILASGQTIEDLFIRAEETGVDMQEVAIEHVVFAGMEINIGGAEFEYVYLGNETSEQP